MLTSLLVCLEGSASTESATRAGIELARQQGAEVVGIAIVDEPDIRAGMATSIGGSSFKRERDEELLADARKHVDDWLLLFERRCADAGVRHRSLQVVGRPSDSILEATHAHDVVVIGRDANFRFETDADDVHTRDAILHRAAKPVLLVPEASAGIGSKVVVAYDGSGAVKRALTSFVNCGLAAGREIHVVTVGDDGAQAWDLARRGVELLASMSIAAELHNVVSALEPGDALIEVCGQIGCDLVVMGAFTRSRLVGLFTRSVTRALAQRIGCPLYLQH